MVIMSLIMTILIFFMMIMLNQIGDINRESLVIMDYMDFFFNKYWMKQFEMYFNEFYNLKANPKFWNQDLNFLRLVEATVVIPE